MGVQFLVQPCPGLVELVEKAELFGPRTEALIVRYISPLLEQGADTIVLGCTHYPFLISTIRAVAGPTVSVVDPAVAVARELNRRLKNSELLARKANVGTEQFWTSGLPIQVQPVVAKLWGENVDIRSLSPAYSAL